MSIELNKKNTPAWRIWHLQYNVVVPAMASYSAEYIRKNAFNVTGDRKVDKLRLHEKEVVRQTVAGMALIMNEGHAIGLRNYKDCVQIYYDIQAHLGNWHDLTLAGTSVSAFPPLEELRLLEGLAIEVYHSAMSLEPRADNQSKIFDSIIQMNMRRNSIATRKYLNNRVTNHTNTIKPYRSLVDDIEQYVLSED